MLMMERMKNHGRKDMTNAAKALDLCLLSICTFSLFFAVLEASLFLRVGFSDILFCYIAIGKRFST